MAITINQTYFRIEQNDGRVTASAKFQAISDSGPVSVAQIEAAAGYPLFGSAFSDGVDTYPNVFCRGSEITSFDKSRKVYEISAKYSDPNIAEEPGGGPDPRRDPTQKPTTPFDEKPRMRFYSRQIREAVLYAIGTEASPTTETPIKSSAGEPYDPVQERNKTKYILEIVRNVDEDKSALNQYYADTRNSQPWFGRDAGAWLCIVPGDIDVLYWGDGTKYFQERWEFELDEETFHNIKLYDWGMYKVNAGELELLKDKDGKQLSSPAFLDGAGDVLPVGDPPVTLSPYIVYRSLNFANLDLPTEL